MTPQELADYTGKVLGQSEWLEIGQDRINQFADATGDHQFIHVDPEAAASSPFGGTVAHGFLTVSSLAWLLENSDMPRADNVQMGVNYGFNSLRFVSPVRSGKRIRSHWTLLDLVEKKPGQWQQTLGVEVEIENEPKPALVCEWVTLFFV
ncbi:MAG: MaoC family dehydratase [Sphingomonadaceae bacterium]